LADERGYPAPGFTRNDHGTVLYFVSREIQVGRDSMHRYGEPGMAERQMHTVRNTLNGFSRYPGKVQFLANVGSDSELAYLE
jgi:hypothetical protein